MPTGSQFSFIWIESASQSIERSVVAEVAEAVAERTEGMGQTITQSRFTGAAIQNAAHSDELARLEDDLDERLERAGVPTGGTLSESLAKIKKSDWPISCEYYTALDPDEKHRFRAKTPSHVVLRMEEAAASPRRQGFWLSNALQMMLDSPFNGRPDRLESKRQLLRIVGGDSIPRSEMTGTVERIADGDLAPEVTRVLFPDALDDEERVVYSAGTVDWSGVSIKEPIRLEQDAQEANLQKAGVPKVSRYRAAAVMAFVRGFDGPLHELSIRGNSAIMNPDYESVENIAEMVIEQAVDEGIIDPPTTDDDEGRKASKNGRTLSL